MRFLKFILLFGLGSIVLSALIYILTGGHVLFLFGFLPLVFGGFWSFGGKRRNIE